MQNMYENRLSIVSLRKQLRACYCSQPLGAYSQASLLLVLSETLLLWRSEKHGSIIYPVWHFLVFKQKVLWTCGSRYPNHLIHGTKASWPLVLNGKGYPLHSIPLVIYRGWCYCTADWCSIGISHFKSDVAYGGFHVQAPKSSWPSAWVSNHRCLTFPLLYALSTYHRQKENNYISSGCS